MFMGLTLQHNGQHQGWCFRPRWSHRTIASRHQWGLCAEGKPGREVSWVQLQFHQQSCWMESTGICPWRWPKRASEAKPCAWAGEELQKCWNYWFFLKRWHLKWISDDLPQAQANKAARTRNFILTKKEVLTSVATEVRTQYLYFLKWILVCYLMIRVVIWRLRSLIGCSVQSFVYK